MLKNELIKEYVMIQNKVNMLTLQINNRIGKITKNITKMMFFFFCLLYTLIGEEK